MANIKITPVIDGVELKKIAPQSLHVRALKGYWPKDGSAKILEGTVHSVSKEEAAHLVSVKAIEVL